MSPLIIVLLAVAPAAVLIAWLVWRGFRDGDIESEVMVRARALGPPQTGSRASGHGAAAVGEWVEVTVTNPSPATALVGLSLRRSRIPELVASGSGRRSPGRRTQLRLADQTLGAVCADEQARFWLWADPDRRRLTVRAAVGTPGRLRLHQVAVERPDGKLRPARPAPVHDAGLHGAWAEADERRTA